MQDEPAIFINYRRRDTLGHARALDEYLRRRFGNDRVFFDRSTIESGDVFPETLHQGVEGCAVLLALIGPEWLDVRGEDGSRRLDDEDDFVRREIALAFELGKKVIPVLFDDTPVPPRDRLPDPLKALASCDALTLRGKTYEYETQRRELVRLLAKAPGMPQPLLEAEKAAAQTDTKRQQNPQSHGKRQPEQQQNSPVSRANPTSSLEAIRSANGVRPLRPLEEDVALRKLPNGVFRFTNALVLAYFEVAAEGDLVRLYPEKTEFAACEIHKSADGDIFVVGFVSQTTQHILDDPSQTEPFDIHVFCNAYDEFVNPIAIPLIRVISCEFRKIGSTKIFPEDILDIRVAPF